MFKKVFSITIIAMLLFNVNTFADTNILSNQQQKVSKVMFERDLKKIIETKKEIIEATKKKQKNVFHKKNAKKRIINSFITYLNRS